MDINNMSARDYLDLYLWINLKNKKFYNDYQDNFKPTRKDVEEYTAKLNQFESVWEKDKSIIHKPIAFEEQTGEVKKDNDFEFCNAIGHKFELWVEKECKKYGVELGMYYDDRQFKGENALGLEIKHDDKLKETNNVYIEYEALTKDESKFYPSGILKKDNCKYWLIGTEEEYYIFRKNDLVKLYEQLASDEKKEYYQMKNGKREWYFGFRERRTSKGIAISREKAKTMMISNNIGEFLVKVGIIE